MTVQLGGWPDDGQRRSDWLVALLGAFAPACYTASWVPWWRWVSASVVVVVVIVVIRLVLAANILLPAPVILTR